jgi:hypothetical protein
MKEFSLHKLRTFIALLSFSALLAVPPAFSADVTPPQLESFNLLTSEINVTEGPASVYAEFRVTDDQSGIERPQIYAYSDTTTQSGKTFGSTVSELSSSNGGLDILYTAEVVINQGSAPGPWTVRLNGLQDKQGNRGPTGPAKLAGYNTAFTVVEDTPDQSSTDASSSSGDSAEADPCSGPGYNPNCSDSGSDSSDDAGTAEADPCSGPGYNPNCSDSSGSSSGSGSSSSGTASTGSGSGSSGSGGSSSDDSSSDAADCDPVVDFGCATSSDGTADTSGTVSSLGVTLEEPAVGLVHMGVGNLRGWAVSSAGIRKVEAFLDGEFLGEIPYGGARTDVGLAFPDIDGSDQSGFGMSFNYSGLSAGTHSIEVVAHSIDNKTASDSAQFETVRFDKEFIGAGEVINLNAAASVLTNDQIRVENISIAGKYYNLLLRWRTAEQGFEIVEIQALD